MRSARDQSSADARILHLAPNLDPARLSLSPSEAYLLSRVDGVTPWHLLREIGGLAPREVDRCLEGWLADGVVCLDGAERDTTAAPAAPGPAPAGATPAQPKPAPPEATAAAAPPTVSEAELDPSLEIPVDVQRRILAFEAQLDRPYHEILGVALDADRKVLKRAYFTLSKEFHPDRYFRRRTEGYAARLERIFRKLVEAYEILADPTARAEIARSLEAPPNEPERPEATAAARPSRRPAHKLRSPLLAGRMRAMADRRRKAKKFFEAGMASFTAGRWLEAAGSVRLAIAFDPWNEVYKEHFAEVQRKAYAERAAQLLREGESCLELRDLPGALAAFEGALDYRPHDPELLHRAARLAWLGTNDLRRAKEYAMRACEVAPGEAPHHRMLGQIYKAAGLAANARRELEAALRIDPNDAEAKAELQGLGRRLPSLFSLGGRR